MAISQRQMTLGEFLELPEAKPALEYEAGRVKQKVSPKGPHGALQFGLGYEVRRFASPQKLAAVFTETRVTFGGQSLVPDLVVYRWERIPLDGNGEVAEDFTIPPDIAVEIISPGQSLSDLEDRCRWYVDHGVEISLLVNPRNRRHRWVKLFRQGHDPVTLAGDELIDLAPILPGLRLSVAELFSALRPR